MKAKASSEVEGCGFQYYTLTYARKCYHTEFSVSIWFVASRSGSLGDAGDTTGVAKVSGTKEDSWTPFDFGLGLTVCIARQKTDKGAAFHHLGERIFRRKTAVGREERARLEVLALYMVSLLVNASLGMYGFLNRETVNRCRINMLTRLGNLHYR